MDIKQWGAIVMTGVFVLNPLAVIAMETQSPVSPSLDIEPVVIVGRESEGIDKPTQLVVEDGQVSLTKNPDSVGEVTVNEISESLGSITGLTEESANVLIQSDADNAIIAETEGSSVQIPRDSSEAIVMESEGVTLEIKLPEVENAEEATTIANGVVAYASQSDFANAVQATEGEGVRMTTVIDNPNAPTEYTYEVTLPQGGYIEVVEEGMALVYDGEGEVLSIVESPWAKDANGNDVETYFTTDGKTLTQVVKHDVPGVVYPVTADPVFIPPLIVIWAAKLSLPAMKLGMVCARNWHGCIQYIDSVRKAPAKIGAFRSWVLRQ